MKLTIRYGYDLKMPLSKFYAYVSDPGVYCEARRYGSSFSEAKALLIESLKGMGAQPILPLDEEVEI